MAVYARCFIGNIFQNNSQRHWEVKIISIVAEGVMISWLSCVTMQTSVNSDTDTDASSAPRRSTRVRSVPIWHKDYVM